MERTDPYATHLFNCCNQDALAIPFTLNLMFDSKQFQGERLFVSCLNLQVVASATLPISAIQAIISSNWQQQQYVCSSRT